MAEKLEEILTGGFDVEFVTAPTIRVYCGICAMTLKNPVQTVPCGHRFCEECFARDSHRYKHSTWNVVDTTLSVFLGTRCCPSCFKPVKEWFHDGALERDILSLVIKCSNYTIGCHDTFELRSLNDHLITCVYVDAQCTNENCESIVQRRYMGEHLTECEYRTLQCEHCNDDYIFKNKQLHEEVCKKFPIQCVNDCGSDVVPREEMAKHLEEVCPNTIHNCIYLDSIGCPVKDTRTKLAEHMENHSKLHLALAIDEIKVLKDDKGQLSIEIKELKDNTDLMSREIKELRDYKHCTSLEIEELKNNKYNMSTEIKDLRDVTSRKLDFLYSLTLKTTWNRASVEIKHFFGKAKLAVQREKLQTFYSDSFVCLDGYQAMLLVVIAKGPDGDVCVGVYFVLVKGPYDDILKWPFEGFIKFSCKGKDGVSPKIEELTTTSGECETIETSFSKPISSNSAYGLKQFIKKDEFDKYIVSNTLSIEVNISKTSFKS